MKHPLSPIKKNIWIVMLGVIVLLVGINFGFVRRLYFWREDFQLINSYFQKTPYYFWPYQGLSAVYYPLNILFNNNPQGYFVVNIALYAILAWELSIVAWKLTRKKFVAVASGLIFASGMFGIEAMYLVVVGTISYLYLSLLLAMITFYKQFLASGRRQEYYWTCGIYLIMLVLFSHRAHILFPVIVLTDIVYVGRRSIRYLVDLVRRVALFFVATLGVFTIVPLVDADTTKHLGQFSWDMVVNLVNRNLIVDLGNLIIPSPVLEFATNKYPGWVFATLALVCLCLIAFFKAALHLKSNKYIVFHVLTLTFFGFIWRHDVYGASCGVIVTTVAQIITMITRSKLIDRTLKRNCLYLGLLILISYLVFHVFEYDLVHQSWHRYFLYEFPFWAILVSMLTVQIWARIKKPIVLGIGLAGIVVFIAGNVLLTKNNSFTRSVIDRSELTNRFVTSLQSSIAVIDRPTLILFAVNSDSTVIAKFNAILAGGVFPQENSLAAIYKTKPSNIKIANDYDDFLSLVESKNYDQKYLFTYSKNFNLRDDSKMFDAPVTNNISRVLGSKTFSDTIELDASSYPAFKPVDLNIEMAVNYLDYHKVTYPFSYPSTKIPTDIDFKLLDEPSYRKYIYKYLAQKEEFMNAISSVESNGDEYPGKAQNIADDNVDTSWISNKKLWRMGEPVWIKLRFNKEVQVSEIRWMSGYLTRIPIEYEYQIPDRESPNWKAIFRTRNTNVAKDKYITDRINKITTRELRMVIYKSNSDFPAVTEINAFKESIPVDSRLVNYLLENPLARIQNQEELQEILENVSPYLRTKIYAISDNYPDIYHSFPIELKLNWDGKVHKYKVRLPANGSLLEKLIVNFPKVDAHGHVDEFELRPGEQGINLGK